MRTWTRLGSLVGGLVLLASAFMPWLGEIRPMQVAVGFLVGASDRMEVLHRGAPEMAGFPGSVGMLLALVALVVIMAGYTGRRRIVLLSGLVGLAGIVLLYGQMLYQAGQLQEFSYGATLGHLSVGLVLLAAWWPAPDPERFEPFDLAELRTAEQDPQRS